ncbi:hypothetical protein GYMLUDRAFT_152982 [Collybiopsis luxurians FD-317 M1]|nr:hypothetical protein GYMLUDRAFT_152982 [Collybiopsis luxurians FD-317 M1]
MLASHSHGPNPSHTSTVGPATFSKTAYSSDGSSDHLNSIIEATAHATALRHRPTSVRSNNSSSLPPPEPPTVLPPPSPTFVLSSPAPEPNPLAEAPPQPIPQPPPVPPITDPSELPPVLPPSRPRRSVPSDFLTSSVGAGPSHTSSSGSILSFPGASGLGSSSSSAPGALGQSANRGSSPNPPAYAPFLSHMPPPADSWIEVETTPAEYRLNIRLPGFKRDGITLATKRRRILHVVADSWPDPDPSPRGGNSTEPSTPSRGGHFERRISFGYDADLVGVRAEFDGEILKIVVPRRQELGWNRPFD